MKFKHVIDDAMHDLSQIKGVSLYDNDKNIYTTVRQFTDYSPLYIIDGTLTFFRVTVNAEDEIRKTFYSFDSIESFIPVKHDRVEYLFNILNSLIFEQETSPEQNFLRILARVDNDEDKVYALPRACARMLIFNNVFLGTKTNNHPNEFVTRFRNFKEKDIKKIKNDLIKHKGDMARFRYYTVAVNNDIKIHAFASIKPYDEVNGAGI